MNWQGMKPGLAVGDVLGMAVALSAPTVMALVGPWWQDPPIANYLALTWLPVLGGAGLFLLLGRGLLTRVLAAARARVWRAEILIALGAGAGMSLGLLEWLRLGPMPGVDEIMRVWRDCALGASILAIWWLGELSLRQAGARHLGNEAPVGNETQADRANLVDRAARILLVLGGCTLAWRMVRFGIPADPLAEGLRVLAWTAPLGLGLVRAAPGAELVGRAGRLGIAIRDLGALDRLTRIRRVSFARRGTLVPDRLKLLTAHAVQGISGSDLIGRAAALYQPADADPFGRAILDFAVTHRMRLKPVEDHAVSEGKGVAARLIEARLSGRIHVVGARDHLGDRGIDCGELAAAADVAAQGRHSVWVGEIDPAPRLLGFLVLGPQAKPGAAEAVKNLARLNLSPDWRFDPRDKAESIIARQLKLPPPDTGGTGIGESEAEGTLSVGAEEADAMASSDAALAVPIGRRLAAGMPNAAIAIAREDPRLIVDLFLLAARYRRMVATNISVVGAATLIVGLAPFLLPQSPDLKSYELVVLALPIFSALGLRFVPTTANEADEE